jgi:hypothetical protein
MLRASAAHHRRLRIKREKIRKRIIDFLTKCLNNDNQVFWYISKV